MLQPRIFEYNSVNRINSKTRGAINTRAFLDTERDNLSMSSPHDTMWRVLVHPQGAKTSRRKPLPPHTLSITINDCDIIVTVTHTLTPFGYMQRAETLLPDGRDLLAHADDEHAALATLIERVQEVL